MNFSDVIKKSLATLANSESFREARKASIYSDEGRVFLIAAADAYGYDVNSDSEIVDGKGKVLNSKSEDYKSIIQSAQKQAMNQSQIGRQV